MAKKNTPGTPPAVSLLPGFGHLVPGAAASPVSAHIRPLFLPDLVQQAARNKQIDAQKRDLAYPVFVKWARDLKAGVLQQLNETQVEQDFNHVLLRALGYTTQSDVAAGQPWTLTPKWPVPGSGEIDAALGKFRFDETGKLTGEPLGSVARTCSAGPTNEPRSLPVRPAAGARLFHGRDGSTEFNLHHG
jgi:hypothetical protein